MDTTQFVIITVTVVLTVLLVVIGIQVFYVLKELRTSLRKTNKILDDTSRVSTTVSDSVVNMTGFINGLKAGISAIATLRGKGDKND